jgi:DNA repair protein RecN (Recombination protein N)
MTKQEDFVIQEPYQPTEQEKKAIAELKESISENQKNEDFMRFQLEELTAANLAKGEQEELEQEQDSASHTEEIK